MSDQPLDDVVCQVVELGIAPLVRRFAKDLGCPLRTTVTIVRDGVHGPVIMIDTATEASSAASDGEVRLRVRETYGGGRFVYLAEAVYRKDVSTVGFSGFVAKGEAIVDKGGRIDVRVKNWTARYNTWGFSEV